MSARVYCTEDFRRDYGRYTGARERAVKVVRNAVRRREQIVDWYDGKRAMRGVGELVYELKITHSDRLLLRTRGDALCLVAMGDHDVTRRYAARSPGERDADYETATAAPGHFDPANDAPLFVDVDGPFEPQWAEELGETWLHFLSDSQLGIKSDLMLKAVPGNPSFRRKTYVGLLAGGAGTGKTALLLNIALDLVEAGVAVDFRCSPQMRKYLHDYTRINVENLTAPSGASRKVVLLDDPESIATVEWAVSDARAAGALAVIVGFDPLQWWDDKRLSTRMPVLESMGEVHHLSTCYRQSANLVKMAQDVSRTVNEKSSWRAETFSVRKEREFLGSLLNDYSDSLVTVKSGGRAKRYDDNIDEMVEREARLLADATRWDDLPVLLVLIDRWRGVKMKRAWKDALRGIRRVDCDIADVQRYRGLDFQSVWIFTSAGLLRQIEEGRVGLGAPEWAELRRLHVALTRAKDNTVVFAQ